MSAVTPPQPRPSRILAGLLSLLAPGAGHLYAGHARRGIVLATVFIVAQPLLVAAAYFVAPTFGAVMLFVVAAVGALLLAYLLIVIDAVRLARRGAGTRWYVWCAGIVAVWLIWFGLSLVNPAIKSRVPWHTYTVASGSMQPTLLMGEGVIADTRYFATNAPARGDVVIYHQRADDTTTYLKRIVALGGDRIAFRDGRAVVNGAAAAEPFADLGDPKAYYANTAEVTVPADHVFVAGDNRANSTDSRARNHGPVPRENLVGRVTEIFLTTDWQRAGLWVGSAR